MQDLIFDDSFICFYAELIALVYAHVLPSTVFCHVYEGKFIRGRSIVFLIAFFVLFDNDIMTQAKSNQHIVDVS
jgi:hypothetical protein